LLPSELLEVSDINSSHQCLATGEVQTPVYNQSRLKNMFWTPGGCWSILNPLIERSKTRNNVGGRGCANVQTCTQDTRYGIMEIYALLLPQHVSRTRLALVSLQYCRANIVRLATGLEPIMLPTLQYSSATHGTMQQDSEGRRYHSATETMHRFSDNLLKLSCITMFI
jgi:hypothetical protein